MPVPKIAMIELDEPRPASFTLGAMCSFKEETGEELSTLGTNLSPVHIRAFLWACLRVHDKAITIEEVGDLIPIEDFPAIVDQLMSLADDSSPEPSDSKY